MTKNIEKSNQEILSKKIKTSMMSKKKDLIESYIVGKLKLFSNTHFRTLETKDAYARQLALKIKTRVLKEVEKRVRNHENRITILEEKYKKDLEFYKKQHKEKSDLIVAMQKEIEDLKLKNSTALAQLDNTKMYVERLKQKLEQKDKEWADKILKMINKKIIQIADDFIMIKEGKLPKRYENDDDGLYIRGHMKGRNCSLQELKEKLKEVK